jgi:interferon gamma-inducible protein 30
MASRLTTTALSFLTYLLILFSFSSSTTILPSNSDKVSLALYYESLCPYSANFIVNYLDKLVEDDDLLSIVDLYLSPWGNAKIRGNDTFVCQVLYKKMTLSSFYFIDNYPTEKVKYFFG